MNRFTKIIFGFLFPVFALMGTSPAYTASLQLTVIGNQIVNSGGCTVRLKGVNVDSMEWSSSGDGPPGQGITATVGQAVTAWHCNIVRIPLNQDWWFGCGNNALSYQNLLDSIVNYCLANDAYVLLDLHWSGKQSGATAPCGTGWGNDSKNGYKQQYMPDDNSVTFWSAVAAHYANSPAVLFDLYNEPYDYDVNGWSIWRNGGTGTSYSFHTPGMQALLNAVRSTGANNVVVMGGLDWAYDLSQVNSYPMTNLGNGIIYSSHIYPFKGSSPWTTADGDNKITPASYAHPIIIGEFGQDPSIGGYSPNPDTNGTWDQALLNWIDLHNYSGTAWDMHTSSGPILISNWSYNPTSYHGVPVKNWLSTPTPTCATATYTSTPTPTFTSTPCIVNGNTCTPTFTPTFTSTPTPTATPSNLYTVFPNPWPDPKNPGDIIKFFYKNDQAADQVQLKVFTPAFRKIYEDDTLPASQGPQPPWPLNLTNLNLSNGLYYFVIVWKNGGQQSQKMMKVLILR